MNYIAKITEESERPYANRNRVSGFLDVDYTIQHGEYIFGVNGYCLDALDELPAGCMTTFLSTPAQKYVSRGRSIAEAVDREELAKKLIAELQQEL